MYDKKLPSGKDRVIDVPIDTISACYVKAIRKHSYSYKDMQKAICSIWYNKRLNDVQITHDFCPDGNDSWCIYNQELANGTLKNFKRANSIPKAVMNKV